MPVSRSRFRRVVPLVAAGLALVPATAAADPLLGGPRPSADVLARAVSGSHRAIAAGRLDFVNRLDSRVRDVAVAHVTGGDVAAAAAREGIVLRDGGVPVDVYVTGDVAAAARRLAAIGMQVEATSTAAPSRMVEGLLPPSKLVHAAALGVTRAVVATATGTNTGGTLSEGDAAHHGPAARALGPTGAGITVGVISDTINRVGAGIAGSQGSGDLPADVTSLNEPATGSDEGRAMAEIIYDEAPGVTKMRFASGTIGAAGKVTSINKLINAGAKVIADDTFLVSEPFFQDGIVAQAADRAYAHNVAYIVSAGNRARQSWEGNYTPVSDPTHPGKTTMDFKPGAGTDRVQAVGVLNGGAFIALQWAEPWRRAKTDFAIDVYSLAGGTPAFAFTVDTDNIASGLPFEFASISAAGVPYGIAIRRVKGTGRPHLKYIAGGRQTVAIERATNSSGVDPDAASARGTIAVAAAQFSTPTVAEPFSSRGAITRRFDKNGRRLAKPEVRKKPAVTGADGVSTSVPGFAPFFGTSAAAPTIAGFATLVRSAHPTMPVAVVYALLTDPRTATDCPEKAGHPDDVCGAGFLRADDLITAAADTTKPVITRKVTPLHPNGNNGWYTRPVTVRFNTSDPQSGMALSGCGLRVITADGVFNVTCVAQSAGGKTTSTVKIKHDGSRPLTPKITGISAKTYTRAQLPPLASIHCKTSDPTSGVAACTIGGYSKLPGRHVIRATARNGAGLTSLKTLTYHVI